MSADKKHLIHLLLGSSATFTDGLLLFRKTTKNTDANSRVKTPPTEANTVIITSEFPGAVMRNKQI